MSDYEKGIEAAEDYVQTAHTGTTARGIIEAFLAEQPEVWWCNEHDSKAPPPGPSGNPGLEKCERLRLDAYIDPSTTQYDQDGHPVTWDCRNETLLADQLRALIAAAEREGR